MTSPGLLVSALLALGAVTACTTTTTTTATPTDGGTSADGGSPTDGGTSGTVAPLTCLEIFQCAADCTGTGCEDACLARGSADAKTAAGGLATCYQTNSCADATCLQTKCNTELGACGAQSAPSKGTPVSTVPPGSAVPSDLVGKWHYFYQPNVATKDWTFNADGTATYHNESSYDMPGGCKWAGITNSTGTVVVQGNAVTYYQTGGTQSSSTCGQMKTEPAPQTSYSYQWSIDGAGKLLLNDTSSQNCIQNPLWDSCHTLFDRQ